MGATERADALRQLTQIWPRARLLHDPSRFWPIRLLADPEQPRSAPRWFAFSRR
jgi:hypothetical protein